MSGPDAFVAALRAELLAAGHRRLEAERRRGRRALAGSAAIVLVVVLAAGLTAGTTIEAGADVVVRIEGHEVVVTLEDLEHDPDRIERIVREAGIDLTVVGVPVGPSAVGRFLGHEVIGPLPPELRPVDGGPTAFRGVARPIGWEGSLRLLLGEPARGAEAYGVFTDALAPSEPLACRPLLGRPAAEAALELDAEPLSVDWFAEAPHGLRRVARPTVGLGSTAGWVVGSIVATGPRSVEVHLVPTHRHTALPPGCRP